MPAKPKATPGLSYANSTVCRLFPDSAKFWFFAGPASVPHPGRTASPRCTRGESLGLDHPATVARKLVHPGDN